MTRSLTHEQEVRQLRVNVISSGTIDTAFHELFSISDKPEKTPVGIPLQRLGAANDCAGTALYLACESLSGYVTGRVTRSTVYHEWLK